jgi:hypothetical protein
MERPHRGTRIGFVVRSLWGAILGLVLLGTRAFLPLARTRGALHSRTPGWPRGGVHRIEGL